MTVTAFAAAVGSLKSWQKRLKDRGVKTDEPTKRFGQDVLGFVDPDNMRLELIFSDKSEGKTLYRFDSVTVAEEASEHTAKLLTETMGFRKTGEDGNRSRFEVATGGVGAIDRFALRSRRRMARWARERCITSPGVLRTTSSSSRGEID